MILYWLYTTVIHYSHQSVVVRRRIRVQESGREIDSAWGARDLSIQSADSKVGPGGGTADSTVSQSRSMRLLQTGRRTARERLFLEGRVLAEHRPTSPNSGQ